MADQQRSPSILIIWQLGVFAIVVTSSLMLAIIVALLINTVSPALGRNSGFFMLAVGMLFGSMLHLRWGTRLVNRLFQIEDPESERLSVGALGLGFDRPWFGHALIGTVLGGGLIALAWLIFDLAGWSVWELKPPSEIHYTEFLRGLFVCVGIAAYEELLFRGYAFQLVARRSIPVALAVSGLLFVAIHLPNEGGDHPVAMLNCLLAHLLFATCYLKTRSLWLAIAVHGMWNFTECFVLGMPFFGTPAQGALLVTELQNNPWTGYAFGPDGGLVVSALLAGATLLIWGLVKQRRPLPDLMTSPAAPVVSAVLEPSSGPQPAIPVPPAARPQAAQSTVQRILAIDVLRGTALLGILPMNMQIFAQHAGGVMYPYIQGFTDSTNIKTWVLLRVFIGTKDLYIFSMLFGAGILMMSRSRESSGRSPGLEHARRMLVLLGMGLIHAYVFWTGDILVTYAIMGLLLFKLRDLGPRLQVFLGLLVFSVPMVMLLLAHFVVPHFPPKVQDVVCQALDPTPEAIAKHNETYSSGWTTQMTDRLPGSIFNQTFGLVACMGWLAGGMMLVGMGLYKLGVLTAKRSNGLYAAMVAVAAFIGFPLLIYGLYWKFQHGWTLPDGFFLGWWMRESAYPFVVVGWIGAVMLICRYGILEWLTAALSAVGQMALTNYLTQTLIQCFIFYGGFGLGLVGRVSHLEQIYITLVIWLTQLIVSPIWLKFYSMGPAEWVWRSLSGGAWLRWRLSRPAEDLAPPLGR